MSSSISPSQNSVDPFWKGWRFAQALSELKEVEFPLLPDQLESLEQKGEGKVKSFYHTLGELRLSLLEKRDPSQLRQAHIDFVELFRKAIALQKEIQDPLDTRATAYLEALATKKMLGTRFFNASTAHAPFNGKNFLEKVFHVSQNDSPETIRCKVSHYLKEEELEHRLSRLALSKLRSIGSIFGFFNTLLFSPTYHLAAVQVGEEGKEKTVHFIRSPCPIIEKGGSIGVAEEFKLYLDVLEKEGKKHLYVNKQARLSYGRWELQREKNRTLAIEKIQEEYPKTFYCLSLPDEGAFFQQKGPFQNLTASQLKTSFCENLMEGHYGFQLPSALFETCYLKDEKGNRIVASPERLLFEKKAFSEKIQRILDFVHQVFFDEKEELSHQERKGFIEIAYTFVELFFIQHLQVDCVNITCKECTDRGIREYVKLFEIVQTLDRKKEILGLERLCREDFPSFSSFVQYFSAIFNHYRNMKKIRADSLEDFRVRLKNVSQHALQDVKKHLSYIQSSLHILPS